MTTQAELDDDLLAVLDQHLASRRDLLKKVKAELMALPRSIGLPPPGHVHVGQVEALMNRFILEAEMPRGSVGG